MTSMECSITDGPQSDDEQIIPEPEFERHEPEDEFSLSIRLRMMINHISLVAGYDQRRLVRLLKDCKKDIDKLERLETTVAESIPIIINLVDKIERSPLGKKQAG